jgi:hypothetical protein
LVIKALDPDPYWIRIGIQPKLLDPDPDQDPDEMNADPQPWLKFFCPLFDQKLQFTYP